MQNMNACRCPHHSLTWIFISLLGLTVFLGNMGIIAEQTASVIWPVFLMLIGLQKAIGRRCKCCSSENCNCGCGCSSCGKSGNISMNR